MPTRASRHIIAAMLAVAVAGPSVFAAEDRTEPDADTLRRAIEFSERIERNMPTPDQLAPLSRAADATIDAGRGDVPVYIPASYDPANPTPLIILLHGYMNNGDEVESYVQLAQFVDSYGFLYVTPTGRRNFLQMEYWNATDACCDLFNNNPDDSAYLRTLVETVQQQYNVDPRRIHFAGHSNGGFMSYRMACDHADLVASIASLAGATWNDPANCTPSEPVSILQIHGTADSVIAYNGGIVPLGGTQPGAPGTTLAWANYAGCDPTPEALPFRYDLTADVAGDDADPIRYVAGCTPGGSARLWTIPSGPHSPVLTQDFRTLMLDFLFAHPKPAPPCPTDLDNDGLTATSDLLILLSAWGTSGGAGDTNGDGLTGTSDLLDVLAAFGQVCPS